MTSNAEFEALKLNQPEELAMEHPDPPERHEWEQRGNDLVCTSCQNRHGHVKAIPNGKMLVKKGDDYDIVPIEPTPQP